MGLKTKSNTVTLSYLGWDDIVPAAFAVAAGAADEHKGKTKDVQLTTDEDDQVMMYL